VRPGERGKDRLADDLAEQEQKHAESEAADSDRDDAEPAPATDEVAS
jgi:hypothetical protein